MRHRSSRSIESVRRLQSKITGCARLARVVRRLQRQRRRVVFTNGCFDIVHPGHVMLLARAKRLGEALVVAINSDRSVRRLKGPSRPVMPARARALVLAGLASVDYVTVFDEATPRRLIQRLQPDVLVKGADWRRGAIVGRDVMEQRGGRVVRIPLVDGYSTTRLLKRMRRERGRAV